MRPGTCGYARTGMQISIQDDNGNEVSPGVTGEICVIGPAVFAGYYNNPEANAKAFRNGWFRTGDLGHMDETGFLFITGRASDMYISGGSNIYPREIEEKILTHPDISEVCGTGYSGSGMGRGRPCGLCCSPRYCAGSGGDHCLAWRQDGSLQNTEAACVLAGDAEIRLWQSREETDPRRAHQAPRTR